MKRGKSILMTVALCSLAGCSKAPADAANAPDKADDAITVAVARAEKSDLDRELVLTAEFRPYQEVDVMAKVAGYVKRIYVDIGDRVRTGQALADLEVPEMMDDRERAEAAVKRYRAEVERMKDELKRAQSAHEITHLTNNRLAEVLKQRPGLVAQQDIDDARGRDLVSEAQVSAARSNLAAAEEQVKVSSAEKTKTDTLLAYTKVTAPFDGVVTKRFADTGSMIQAGTASQSQAMPVVRLSQNSLLRLILPVPESAVPQILIGAQVEVRVPSLNRSFTGLITRSSQKLDLASRTMEVEVDVPNPTLTLVPGMYAEARLGVDHRKGVLTVPVQAIGGTEEKPLVYAVGAGKKIEVRPVELGMHTADRVEVKSGLGDGDLVVVGNRSQLTAGQPVTPKVMQAAAGGAH